MILAHASRPEGALLRPHIASLNALGNAAVIQGEEVLMRKTVVSLLFHSYFSR